jgi:hypothetical protein
MGNMYGRIPTRGTIQKPQQVSIVQDNSQNQYTIRVDTSNLPTIYLGYAPPGSSENAAVWQIIQYNVSTSDLSGLFANGVPDATNIWTNRAGLSYS